LAWENQELKRREKITRIVPEIVVKGTYFQKIPWRSSLRLKNLVLMDLTEDDLDNIRRIATDPEVMK
jgi:hypothetical protein